MTILNTYSGHHRIFFMLWCALILLLIIIPNLNALGVTNSWIIGAIVLLLTVIFFIINIIDTIRVLKIITPNPTEMSIIVAMYLLLTPFAGFYVKHLIENYKKNLSKKEDF